MPSIATRAANIKQRQKIANASGYWNRLGESKKDGQGNPPLPPQITKEQFKCKECHAKRWFKFMRCPECQALQ